MTFRTMTAAVAMLALTAPIVSAGGADDDTLTINGDLEITTKAEAAPHLDGHLDEVISGWHFRSDETQALEMDDFDNPGMIFVDQAMYI